MLSLASSRIELSVTWQTLAVGCAAQLKINLGCYLGAPRGALRAPEAPCVHRVPLRVGALSLSSNNRTNSQPSSVVGDEAQDLQRSGTALAQSICTKAASQGAMSCRLNSTSELSELIGTKPPAPNPKSMSGFPSSRNVSEAYIPLIRGPICN